MANLNQIVINIVGNATGYLTSLRSVVSSTQSASTQVTQSVQKISKSTDDLGKSLGKMKEGGNIISGMATKMLLFTGSFYAVAALRNLIGGSIEEFRRLDEQLRNIQSITLESDASIQQLAKSLEGMVLSGNSAGNGAADLAAAMYEVVSSGYQGAEAIGLVEIAAKGASAGLTDTKSSADALMTILQSYKMPASEAANVMDQLFTIVNLGRIHFDELNTGMGYLIPTAAALKVPLNEVGAAIEMLTRQGQMPSRVMTNLNDVLTRFLKPNKEFAAAIKAMGFESGATMIKQLGLVESVRRVSEYAAAGAPGLVDNSKATEKMGEASRQARQHVDDMNESLRRQKVELDAAKAALAKLRPGAKGYAEAQEKVTRLTYDYNKAQREAGDATRKLAADNKALTETQKAGAGALQDADSLLTQWMGDVRAIRAILPLAANGGRDFNDMLAAHNREIALGGRMEKALAEQKKSFNYQIRALTSNLKALGAILVGPVVGGMAKLLRSINDLIAKVVIWDEKTKTVTFIWEKYPDMLKKVEAGIYGVAAAITVRLIPSIVNLGQKLVELGLKILGATGPMGWILLIIALIVGGIIAYLKYTGKLDGIIESLKKKGMELFTTVRDFLLGLPWEKWAATAKRAFDTVKAEFQELIRFFMLGFAGGDIGGKHNPFERLAFNIGHLIHDIIPKAKKAFEDITGLVKLFLLGFQGGQIGGEFSDIEKKVFAVGQILRQVYDWITQKFIPGFMKFAEGLGKEFVGNVVLAFETLRNMFDDLMASPSFQAFVAWIEKMINEYGPQLIQVIGDAATKIYEFFKTETGQEILKWALRIGMIVAAIYLLPAAVVGAVAAFITLWATFNAIDRILELVARLKEIWAGLPGPVREALSLIAQDIYDKLVNPILKAIDTVKALPALLLPALKLLAAMFIAELNFAKWIGEAIAFVVSNFYRMFIAPLEPEFSMMGDALLHAFIIAFKLKEALEGIITAVANPANWAKALGSLLDIGTSMAEAIAKGFKEALKRLLSGIKIKFGGKYGIPRIELGIDLLGFAKGVRDFAGGLAMVGERGPELAFLPGGTSIATASKTSNIMDRMEHGGGVRGMGGSGGGAGGMTVAPTYNINGSAADVVRQLKENADEVGRQMRLRQQRMGAPLSGRF